MKLPVRKCYYVAKVSFCLMLVGLILSLFEQWRGKQRSVGAQVTSLEDEYERQIREDEANIVPGLGDGGDPAHLIGAAKRLGEESEKKLAINVYLSDRIAYNRTLKDHRNPACQRVLYDAELPSASVIVIFHNEPYSVVVRTIWSVVNSARRDQPWYARANYVERNTGRKMVLGYPGQDPSSPFVYLKEIILVDDNSTLPELKGKLSHYIQTRLPPDLIKILRLPDRVGLTRARLAGARYATGEVLVFLDAHCEAQPDWLRPLLQRTKDAPRAVTVPIIDVIESSDFYYSVQDAVTFQGLMRARITGARAARGDVLVFLDAHCEAGADWLRPLLQRIAHKRDAVLTPLIDVIDQTTFQLEAADQFQVGGFTFMGHFTWIDVPEWEKKRRGSDIAPTWSPTMAGGLFAINRQYYWELGAYDEQMAGWGGENLEMSFRIWQCGGTLETIPCSRVGHVFRSFHPYGLPAQSDTHGINTARMAEVWMDEYAELFYLHRPDLRKNPKIGDVTHRRVLREKLKCKSFQWYLDHVYRDKFVPVRDVSAFGRVQNPSTGLCLDSLQREAAPAALGVYPCHARLEPTQYYALSLARQLRDEERCAELQYTRSQLDEQGSRRVLMVACHDKMRGQRWRHLPSQQLQHEESGLCLAAPAGAGAGGDVTARRCAPDPRQRWLFDYTEQDHFRINKEGDLTEQEIRLQKLRGSRRISRSLMSYNETDQRRHRKRGRKRGRGKSKKRSDRFVLRLVRGGGVGEAAGADREHLEARLWCRHRRLLPNDSLVRDVVAALNDRDIAVINNGRVFENHRVRNLREHHVALPQPDYELKTDPPKKKKDKGKRKPEVQPVGVDTAAPPPRPPLALHALPAPPPRVDPGVMRLNQDNDKKIIIEDFVEVPPAAPAPAKRKRKKVIRGKAVPLVPQRTAPLETVSLEDSPLDAQVEARARDTDSGEARAAPRRPHAHRHTHVHLDIDDNNVDISPTSPTKVDQNTQYNLLKKKINFKKVFQQVDDGISNKYNLDNLQSDSESQSGKVKVHGDDKVVYTDHGYRISDEIDGYEKARDDEQGDISPSSLYTNRDSTVRQPAAGGRHPHAHTPAPHTPDRTFHEQDSPQRDARMFDRTADPRKAQDDGDQDSGATYPRVRDGASPDGGPVRVVMRSNLTFNLGDEFFNWKQAADDVANLLGDLAIPGNATTPSSDEEESRAAPGEGEEEGKGRPGEGVAQGEDTSESSSEEP